MQALNNTTISWLCFLTNKSKNKHSVTVWDFTHLRLVLCLVCHFKMQSHSESGVVYKWEITGLTYVSVNHLLKVFTHANHHGLGQSWQLHGKTNRELKYLCGITFRLLWKTGYIWQTCSLEGDIKEVLDSSTNCRVRQHQPSLLYAVCKAEQATGKF